MAKEEIEEANTAVEVNTFTLNMNEDGKIGIGNKDEYEEDSSDEEDLRNTVGNIPLNWYDTYKHLGYDLDGKKIIKPMKKDELDHFLSRVEGSESGVTVEDPITGQEVILSPEDIQLLEKFSSQNIPATDYDLYAPWVDFFSCNVLETPLRALPEPKRSFIPSLDEKRMVGKMLHSIKMGWMKPKPKKDDEDEAKFYMLWDTDDQKSDMRRIDDLIPAPKMRLPGHSESYNPPPEFIFSEREESNWDRQEEEPWKRKLPYKPQKYSSLRVVPAYDKFIKERFDRCLDLYLAPRAKKMRLTIQPEYLVPQLPKPKDLQPFPTLESVRYEGHKNMVRSISPSPCGQFLASGSDDFTLKVWEVATGRCLNTIKFSSIVRNVAWCPNSALSLLLVVIENKVLVVNADEGDKLVIKRTTEILSELPEKDGYVAPQRVTSSVTWVVADRSVYPDPRVLLAVEHFTKVKQVTWHGRGDYFSVVLQGGQNRAVLIHQLSQAKSQFPFAKAKGLVQAVTFHPIKPFLFVATQRHIRIYDLVKQELTKKLASGAKWISSLDIHPAGDNLIVGTFDKRVLWFDLDLSTMPYKTLRYHTNACRSVCYHKRYPLFASCSDDCSITISHGMVYNDLLQNPLVVPVKILKGHTKYDDFGVLDVAFHPYQPWIFSSGSDATIRLWT